MNCDVNILLLIKYLKRQSSIALKINNQLNFITII